MSVHLVYVYTSLHIPIYVQTMSTLSMYVHILYKRIIGVYNLFTIIIWLHTDCTYTYIYLCVCNECTFNIYVHIECTPNERCTQYVYT